MSCMSVVRWRSLLTVSSMALLVALAVGAPGAVGALSLPDGRVYELVSPPEKNGGNVAYPLPAEGQLLSASSVDGEEITFESAVPFGDSEAGSLPSTYIASRGGTSWQTHAIDPAVPPTTESQTLDSPGFVAFSPDLSQSVFFSPDVVDGTGAVVGQNNLYLRSSGLFVPFTSASNPREEFPTFGGGSAGWSHIIFSFDGALTSNATPGEHSLYEWVAATGEYRLVNILPGNGGVAHLDHFSGFGSGESSQTSPGADLTHAISEDGSRIFWNDGGQGGDLYLREDGERTVQVDESQGPGVSGGGRFWVASADGSEVFFTDKNQLTVGSTARGACGGGWGDLYEYTIAGHQLRDLTTADPEGGCLYGVLGAAGDGSYVYLVAAGHLISGAARGQPNLYVWHEGELTLIATLAGSDESDWSSRGVQARSVRVSPDGRFLAFQSIGSLQAGYDNSDVTTGQPDSEVYLYDAATGKITCVSCDPSGVRPTGDSLLPTGETEIYAPRALLDDGSRLFFNSSNALTPQDTNGTQDVYEWEQDGTGTCRHEGGCVFLISSGTSGDISTFADASADGRDVFFTTTAQLVLQDQDQQVDLYDAREGGGFPNQPAPPTCEGEACKAQLSTAPLFVPSASATFTGAGNLLPSAVTVKPKTSGKAKPKHRKPRKHRAGKKGKGKHASRSHAGKSATKGRG
jgi:hypothetical protein